MPSDGIIQYKQPSTTHAPTKLDTHPQTAHFASAHCATQNQTTTEKKKRKEKSREMKMRKPNKAKQRRN